MKILIDIGHPAHVHFYRKPIQIWQANNIDVVVTSRKKEIATDLLDAIRVKHKVLSEVNEGNLRGMLGELWQRDKRLYKVVCEEQPDILTGIGGIFAAHVGFITRKPSIIFYDTENANLSNLITYPVSSLVVVPDCYQAWLPPWNLKYPGYHELSYLDQRVFSPDKELAINLGLSPHKKNFLIRTVSWKASHDLAEKRWTPELLRRIVSFLSEKGEVIISSERKLPHDLQKFVYKGPPEQIHHLMGHIDMFIGESATMASECAVMGVPAIYLAATGRGYTDDQETYSLVFNIKEFEWEQITQIISKVLSVEKNDWKKRQNIMLQKKTDVASFVSKLIMDYPQSVVRFRKLFSSGQV